jgi:NAD(P)-dependent dehydrogenase (short-subunit alcohol dehydrogenase family)
MMSAPIVVVTGANRGIGFEISRQLATRGAQVILTARKLDAGKAAVNKLAAQNLAVQFRPLDVTSSKSIIALAEFLKRTYGRMDVLINNAGIIAKSDAPGLEVDLETVRITLETNALVPSITDPGAVTRAQQARSHREYIEWYGRILRNGRRLCRLSPLEDRPKRGHRDPGG